MAITFSPHITSPKGGEVFNLGEVEITWDVNSPLTDDEYNTIAVVSYELEYTEKYDGDKTVWHTIKRRIPSTDVSFTWVVGKMIKSNSARIRIRARNITDSLFSEWSMISGDFSVNVFKLIPPAIVSPIGNRTYTDFILVVLDESITKDTYNQKVRYTLEYSSRKQSLDWVIIVKDIPVGQNIIRWNLDDLVPSDDYVLRVTAKNVSTSCISSESSPDQIVRRFVYNLKIQQPGMFFVDTQPPQAVLELEGNLGITNQLVQTLNVFADDATTDVEQIQIRECDTSTQIALGDVNSAGFGTVECQTIEQILSENTEPNFDRLIGKPTGYATKSQWTFEDKSGNRRLEALITDSGGNTSLQDMGNIFIPAFKNSVSINDFVIVQEQRDNISFGQDGSNSGTMTVTTEPATFEVVYLVTSTGQYWILEPFPRLVHTVSSGLELLFNFGGQVYIFGYISISDVGTVFRDDKTAVTSLFVFPNSLSKPNAIAEFSDDMYIGLENGELWKYNGVSFTLIKTFTNSISTLSGDNIYLYIGLFNSPLINLYDGTSFFESDVS